MRNLGKFENAVESMRHPGTIRVKGRARNANVRLSIFLGRLAGKYGSFRRYGNVNPLRSTPGDYCPLSRILTTPSRRRRELLASAAERRECTAARSLYLS